MIGRLTLTGFFVIMESYRRSQTHKKVTFTNYEKQA